MNYLQTTAIVLARTDFGEADRILTVITPDSGKLRLLAKGVRRIKSKLAGGVELFSVSQITYLRGRGEISTLVSARLTKHYGKIVSDITRTMLGYDIIKMVNKNTEDEPEPDYFNLLQAGLSALEDTAIAPDLIRVWFMAQLMRLAGHAPNLTTDNSGARLQADKQYNFSFDDMAFADAGESGRFDVNSLKAMRLLFSDTPLTVISKVSGINDITETLKSLFVTIGQYNLRS